MRNDVYILCILLSARQASFTGPSTAVQTASALEHLLHERVVQYSAVLAAVEQDAALARHGLTQKVLSAMLGIGLQPLLLARHSEGPLGLHSLDLEATARCAWLTYFKNCACSSTPVTQVQPLTCSSRLLVPLKPGPWTW